MLAFCRVEECIVALLRVCLMALASFVVQRYTTRVFIPFLWASMTLVSTCRVTKCCLHSCILHDRCSFFWQGGWRTKMCLVFLRARSSFTLGPLGADSKLVCCLLSIYLAKQTTIYSGGGGFATILVCRRGYGTFGAQEPRRVS